jgi:hypothetical protein
VVFGSGGDTVRLQLSSQPPGALVQRGEEELGTTPMVLELDPEDHRPLMIEKKGYLPFSYTLPKRGAGEEISFEAVLPKDDEAVADVAKPETPPQAKDAKAVADMGQGSQEIGEEDDDKEDKVGEDKGSSKTRKRRRSRRRTSPNKVDKPKDEIKLER